jgi:hypothetical protein
MRIDENREGPPWPLVEPESGAGEVPELGLRLEPIGFVGLGKIQIVHDVGFEDFVDRAEVPALEEIHDALVLGEVLLQLLAREALLQPHELELGIELVKHLEELFVAGPPGYFEMEAAVELVGGRVVPRFVRPAAAGRDLAEARVGFGVRDRGETAHGQLFQPQPHRRNVPRLAGTDRRDAGVAPRLDRDQTVFGEAPESLTHGGSAYVEQARQLELWNAFAARERSIEDMPFDVRVDLVGYTRRVDVDPPRPLAVPYYNEQASPLTARIRGIQYTAITAVTRRPIGRAVHRAGEPRKGGRMEPTAGPREWDRSGVLRKMLEPVRLPRMARIRQEFEDGRIEDLPAAIAAEFAKPRIARSLRPGMSVGITVGSRGVANIAIIVREIARNVRLLGGNPFVFPAMGSHGGATAEGQRAMLEGFGVTEGFVGAPIRASMETRIVGHTAHGKPVHVDAVAAAADGVIVVGRVKPHSNFRGELESDLMTMMAIGMGKHRGAETIHHEGFGKMEDNVKAFGRVVLERAGVLFGVAIVENASDATRIVEAIPKEEIEAREPELLRLARGLMPALPFPEFDVLVVDRIGKNFSGEGADPNVTGFYATPYASGGPRIQRYVVLGLSEETHGNSLGVGIADFTTKRVFDRTDFDAVYPNALTSRVLQTAKMPIVVADDRTAVKAALYSCVDIDHERPRVVRIADTSSIDELRVSEALLDRARAIRG